MMCWFLQVKLKLHKFFIISLLNAITYSGKDKAINVRKSVASNLVKIKVT